MQRDRLPLTPPPLLLVPELSAPPTPDPTDAPEARRCPRTGRFLPRTKR